MSMSPSVESSSFSQYSSNPTPPPTTGGGVGTTGWFKGHALLILLLVISLVAVLWYLSRRSGISNATSSPDAGYPLGYPSVGTSGGSNATTGSGGTLGQGAIDSFMQGYNFRDGQIQPSGTTPLPPLKKPAMHYTTPNPLSPNIILKPVPSPQPITTPPPLATKPPVYQTYNLVPGTKPTP